jgi:hypothetical protein
MDTSPGCRYWLGWLLLAKEPSGQRRREGSPEPSGGRAAPARLSFEILGQFLRAASIQDMLAAGTMSTL